MNVFLSGGAGGIGGAIVRRLSRRPDVRVFLTYHGSAERARMLEQEHVGVKALRCDLSDPAAVESLVRELTPIEFDAVINNAFPRLELKPLAKVSWGEVERSLAVGVRSAFELSRAFSASMKRRKSGVIVNVLSSVVLADAPAQMLPYVVAKHALLGLHKALAAELGKHGVRVESVSPNMVRTEFLSLLPDHYVALAERQAPGQGLLEPDEVAADVERRVFPV